MNELRKLEHKWARGEELTDLEFAVRQLGNPNAAAELAYYQTLEKAVQEFVNADGRNDPPAKYAATRRRAGTEGAGMKVHKLKDDWLTQKMNLAFDVGNGKRKDLDITVRFDGNGNAVVRFLVSDHGKKTEYEKFDAAADAYNRLP
jgi:hypothetical protein